MVEEVSGEPNVGNAADEGPQDRVSRWVEALDRWVTGIDLGRGRREYDPLYARGAGNVGSAPSGGGTGPEPAVGA